MLQNLYVSAETSVQFNLYAICKLHTVFFVVLVFLNVSHIFIFRFASHVTLALKKATLKFNGCFHSK